MNIFSLVQASPKRRGAREVVDQGRHRQPVPEIPRPAKAAPEQLVAAEQRALLFGRGGQEGVLRQQQLPAGDGAAPAAPSAGAAQADGGLEQQQGEAQGEHRGGQQPRSGM